MDANATAAIIVFVFICMGLALLAAALSPHNLGDLDGDDHMEEYEEEDE